MPEKIDIEASKNEDFNKLKLSDLNKRLHKIYEGGGEKGRSKVLFAPSWLRTVASRVLLLVPMLLLANASISQHQYTEAEQEEMRRIMGMGGTPDWVMVVAGLLTWAIIMLLLTAFIRGYARRCRNCRSWWARKVTKTQDLRSYSNTTTRNESRSVTSWTGKHVGDVWIPVTRTKWFQEYQEFYECKKCGHAWHSGVLTRRK